MVDMCDFLPVLIAQGRAHHDEYHRPGPAGFFIDFLDVGTQRDLVARVDGPDKLNILARIEARAPA